MTKDQNELPLFGKRPAPIAEPDPNIAFLVSILLGSDWLTYKQIAEIVFARTNIHWSDRKVRELASMSQGHISSGQRGYKLTREMTLEEAVHTCNALNSQATEMQKRVVEIRKVFYGGQTMPPGVKT